MAMKRWKKKKYEEEERDASFWLSGFFGVSAIILIAIGFHQVTLKIPEWGISISTETSVSLFAIFSLLSIAFWMLAHELELGFGKTFREKGIRHSLRSSKTTKSKSPKKAKRSRRSSKRRRR